MSGFGDKIVSRRTAFGIASGALAFLALGPLPAFGANEGSGSDNGDEGSGSVGITDIFHDVVWYDPDPQNPPQGWDGNSTNWWFSLMTGGKQDIYSPSFTGIAATGQGFFYAWNERVFRETCSGALSAARANYWEHANAAKKAKWGNESSNVPARIVAVAIFTSADRDKGVEKPANYSWIGLHIRDNWNESYDTSQIPSGTARYFHQTKSKHTIDADYWERQCQYDTSKTWYEYVRGEALSHSDDGNIWVSVIAVCIDEPAAPYGYVKVRKNLDI